MGNGTEKRIKECMNDRRLHLKTEVLFYRFDQPQQNQRNENTFTSIQNLERCVTKHIAGKETW
jgi:hypothetical protein